MINPNNKKMSALPTALTRYNATKHDRIQHINTFSINCLYRGHYLSVLRIISTFLPVNKRCFNHFQNDIIEHETI